MQEVVLLYEQESISLSPSLSLTHTHTLARSLSLPPSFFLPPSLPASLSDALHPTPYTLHSTLYTLHLTLETRNPKQRALALQPRLVVKDIGSLSHPLFSP